MKIKNYNVLQIKSEETHTWLLHKHYAKRLPNIMYAFGLYYYDNLVGVITYGKPASNSLCIGVCGKKNAQYVIELNRLCLLNNKKNEASFLISKSLKLLKKPKIIVSYADDGMNHNGYVYQATNFLYTGLTAKRTDVDTGGKHSRHTKGYDISKRKIRTSKHRYIFFVADKKTKKLYYSQLNYKILPYPKNISKKYDSGDKLTTQLIMSLE
tara:strand:- start:519 stop:1151 length:633 start_codon:yes stop_codon:yes gene_type:complete